MSFGVGLGPAFGDSALHVVVTILVEVFHKVHQRCVGIGGVFHVLELLAGLGFFSFLKDVSPVGGLSLFEGKCDAVGFYLQFACRDLDVLVQGFQPKTPVFPVEVSNLQVYRIALKVCLNIVLVVQTDLV